MSTKAKVKPVATRPARARHVAPPGKRLQAAQGGEVEQLRLLMAQMLEQSNRKIADLQGENETLRCQVDTLTADLATRTMERDEAIRLKRNILDNLFQYAGQWVYISEAPYKA